jgi:hypothetical protein
LIPRPCSLSICNQIAATTRPLETYYLLFQIKIFIRSKFKKLAPKIPQLGPKNLEARFHRPACTWCWPALTTMHMLHCLLALWILLSILVWRYFVLSIIQSVVACFCLRIFELLKEKLRWLKLYLSCYLLIIWIFSLGELDFSHTIW